MVYEFVKFIKLKVYKVSELYATKKIRVAKRDEKIYNYICSKMINLNFMNKSIAFFCCIALEILTGLPAGGQFGPQAGFVNPVSDRCEGEETFYSLEEALKEPEKVIKLDIAMLKLTEISPEISKLVNLECLDLSFNRISTLPQEFSKLTKLRILDLTGTRYLAKLPGVLTKLPALEEVNLKNHPEWSADAREEAVKLLPHVNLIFDTN